ncbi:MAG: hypothetical protein ISR58_20700 [Anaerolineales bacterium]|nr:hypothetical protein [Anaerolineales bacterium]
MSQNQLTIPLRDHDAKIIKTEVTAQGELVVTFENPIEGDPTSLLENSIFSSMPSLSQIATNSSLDTFARAIVHDLRNPLSAIIGFADMLANERQEFTEQQLDTITTEILLAGKKLNGMLNTLSSFLHEESK